MPVSFWTSCRYGRDYAIAKKHKFSFIEDACQSFGAEYKGKKSCNLSTIGCTSFFPSQTSGCYGDGVPFSVTMSEIAAKMKFYFNHGQV